MFLADSSLSQLSWGLSGLLLQLSDFLDLLLRSRRAHLKELFLARSPDFRKHPWDLQCLTWNCSLCDHNQACLWTTVYDLLLPGGQGFHAVVYITFKVISHAAPS